MSTGASLLAMLYHFTLRNAKGKLCKYVYLRWAGRSEPGSHDWAARTWTAPRAGCEQTDRSSALGSRGGTASVSTWSETNMGRVVCASRRVMHAAAEDCPGQQRFDVCNVRQIPSAASLQIQYTRWHAGCFSWPNRAAGAPRAAVHAPWQTSRNLLLPLRSHLLLMQLYYSSCHISINAVKSIQPKPSHAITLAATRAGRARAEERANMADILTDRTELV